jgi:heme/copper-type cytochrome/quinol oxidase subunit 2
LSAIAELFATVIAALIELAGLAVQAFIELIIWIWNRNHEKGDVEIWHKVVATILILAIPLSLVAWIAWPGNDDEINVESVKEGEMEIFENGIRVKAEKFNIEIELGKDEDK